MTLASGCSLVCHIPFFLAAIVSVFASSLDTSINFGSGFDREVLVIRRDKQGRLLVGGRFDTFNGESRAKIVRLLPSGELDSTFNPGAGPKSGFLQDGRDTGQVSEIVPLDDGSMFVHGSFVKFADHPVNMLAHLREDGSVNEAFALAYGDSSRNFVAAPGLDGQGRMILSGRFTTLQGVAVTNLARLSLDGAVDTTFEPELDGPLSLQHIYPDGRMLLARFANDENDIPTVELVRLDSEGKLDRTFVNTPEYGQFGRLCVQPDGKILAVYGNPFRTTFLKRLLPDGTLDSGFSAPSVVQGSIWALGLQPDGNIIVGGDSAEVNTTLTRGLIRLGPNGALDETYPSGYGTQSVMACLVLPDGRVVFGGFFTEVDFAPHNRIAAMLARSPLTPPVITSSPSPTTLSLSWKTARNGIFRFEETDALGNWRIVRRETGNGLNDTVHLPITLTSNRFFRVVMEPR